MPVFIHSVLRVCCSLLTIMALSLFPFPLSPQRQTATDFCSLCDTTQGWLIVFRDVFFLRVGLFLMIHSCSPCQCHPWLYITGWRRGVALDWLALIAAATMTYVAFLALMQVCRGCRWPCRGNDWSGSSAALVLPWQARQNIVRRRLIVTRRQVSSRTLEIWSRCLRRCLHTHLALPLIIKPMNSCRLLGLIERAEFSPDSHICIINYLLERSERQQAASVIWLASTEPRSLCVLSGSLHFCERTPQR